uniref:chorismate mutase n=1 Tax=Cyanothece sp. (strain PCC 7425 / ATCC 29141) TaxID=395961 RepID=B8HQF0_CYAP4
MLQPGLLFLLSSALLLSPVDGVLADALATPLIHQVENPVAPLGEREQALLIDRLLDLIQQRLMIQHQVARWKWNQQKPIEDPKREEALLNQVGQQATLKQIDPQWAIAFFRWQIQAGKLIQIADFQTWQHQQIGSFANVPDLNQTLRPQLDQLNLELLQTLVQLTPILACPATQKLIAERSRSILRGEGIDATVRRVALAPLMTVQLPASRDCSPRFNTRKLQAAPAIHSRFEQ